jgi:hypothetical protein
MNVGGNNLKFLNLKVIGFGTKARRECFAMGIMPRAYGTKFGNVLVRDCSFTSPATANKDGATVLLMLAVDPLVLTNAKVSHCTFSNVKSYFSYSHAMQAVNVDHCLVSDLQNGIYFEPDSTNGAHVGTVTLRDNKFYNVDNGIYLYMHAGTHFGTITAIGNEISLNNQYGNGLVICDTCDAGKSGTVTNCTFLKNIIRYSGWVPQPAGTGDGILYSDMRNAVFENNIIALGTLSDLRIRPYPSGYILPVPPVEDCDHPGPFPPGTPTYPPSLDILPSGYKRVWCNNRNLSGTLLNVRFSNNGLDGLANQQQWPEQ